MGLLSQPSFCIPLDRAQPRRFAVADRLAGAVLLAASSPVIVASALTVLACSRRSPFVAHLRVGHQGGPLWVWKLRTMWDKLPPGEGERGWVQRIVAEPPDHPKDPRNPRVPNWFAAFCRKHSIDELPQLWQVARGEMSLVGPRPVTRSELIRHYGPHIAELLSVKPGLTGLWQTQGRSALDWEQRVALDLELVSTSSAKLSLSVLLRTIAGVITGHGAW